MHPAAGSVKESLCHVTRTPRTRPPATESDRARCTHNTQHCHHGEERQHHYFKMISALSKVWDVIREELRGAIGLWKQPCISDRYQLFAISFRDNQGKRPSLFFYSDLTSWDEWLVNKPDFLMGGFLPALWYVSVVILPLRVAPNPRLFRGAVTATALGFRQQGMKGDCYVNTDVECRTGLEPGCF